MQQGHRGSNGTTLASPKQRQAPDRPGSGELRTFLTTGEETAGAFFMAEISVSPGGGTPPPIHSRGRANRFTSSKGMLAIQVGGNTSTASAGDFVYRPSGIAHSFTTPETAGRRPRS